MDQAEGISPADRSLCADQQLRLFSEDASTTPEQRLRTVSICGRRLPVSPVFDTYWRFAAKRQALYEARRSGVPGPWTGDNILRRFRFTNCYRAADRVSQFLLTNVA